MPSRKPPDEYRPRLRPSRAKPQPLQPPPPAPPARTTRVSRRRAPPVFPPSNLLCLSTYVLNPITGLSTLHHLPLSSRLPFSPTAISTICRKGYEVGFASIDRWGVLFVMKCEVPWKHPDKSKRRELNMGRLFVGEIYNVQPTMKVTMKDGRSAVLFDPWIPGGAIKELAEGEGVKIEVAGSGLSKTPIFYLPSAPKGSTQLTDNSPSEQDQMSFLWTTIYRRELARTKPASYLRLISTEAWRTRKSFFVIIYDPQTRKIMHAELRESLKETPIYRKLFRMLCAGLLGVMLLEVDAEQGLLFNIKAMKDRSDGAWRPLNNDERLQKRLVVIDNISDEILYDIRLRESQKYILPEEIVDFIHGGSARARKIEIDELSCSILKDEEFDDISLFSGFHPLNMIHGMPRMIQHRGKTEILAISNKTNKVLWSIETTPDKSDLVILAEYCFLALHNICRFREVLVSNSGDIFNNQPFPLWVNHAEDVPGETMKPVYIGYENDQQKVLIRAYAVGRFLNEDTGLLEFMHWDAPVCNWSTFAIPDDFVRGCEEGTAEVSFKIIDPYTGETLVRNFALGYEIVKCFSEHAVRKLMNSNVLEENKRLVLSYINSGFVNSLRKRLNPSKWQVSANEKLHDIAQMALRATGLQIPLKKQDDFYKKVAEQFSVKRFEPLVVESPDGDSTTATQSTQKAPASSRKKAPTRVSEANVQASAHVYSNGNRSHKKKTPAALDLRAALARTAEKTLALAAVGSSMPAVEMEQELNIQYGYEKSIMSPTLPQTTPQQAAALNPPAIPAVAAAVTVPRQIPQGLQKAPEPIAAGFPLSTPIAFTAVNPQSTPRQVLTPRSRALDYTAPVPALSNTSEYWERLPASALRTSASIAPPPIPSQATSQTVAAARPSMTPSDIAASPAAITARSPVQGLTSRELAALELKMNEERARAPSADPTRSSSRIRKLSVKAAEAAEAQTQEPLPAQRSSARSAPPRRRTVATRRQSAVPAVESNSPAVGGGSNEGMRRSPHESIFVQPRASLVSPAIRGTAPVSTTFQPTLPGNLPAMPTMQLMSTAIPEVPAPILPSAVAPQQTQASLAPAPAGLPQSQASLVPPAASIAQAQTPLVPPAASLPQTQAPVIAPETTAAAENKVPPKKAPRKRPPRASTGGSTKRSKSNKTAKSAADVRATPDQPVLRDASNGSSSPEKDLAQSSSTAEQENIDPILASVGGGGSSMLIAPRFEFQAATRMPSMPRQAFQQTAYPMSGHQMAQHPVIYQAVQQPATHQAAHRSIQQSSQTLPPPPSSASFRPILPAPRIPTMESNTSIHSTSGKDVNLFGNPIPSAPAQAAPAQKSTRTRKKSAKRAANKAHQAQ